MVTTHENCYPFHWLESVVEIQLNPSKVDLKKISEALLRDIQENLHTELAKVISCLKTQTFSLYQSEHLKAVAGHYDQAVRLLQKQAVDNLKQYPKKGLLRQTGEMIVNGLDEVSQCLYSRCPDHLNPKSRAFAGDTKQTANLIDKVLCALSADQLGILLRDVGILVGRSFRKICSAVAPFLSTPWKKNLKADTLRSHATRPEFRDKEVAIDFLEKVIEKIKGYR